MRPWRPGAACRPGFARWAAAAKGRWWWSTTATSMPATTPFPGAAWVICWKRRCDFVKKWNELGIDPPKKDERPQESPFDVVMVYGVHLPNGGYKPVWPNKSSTGQDLTFTATDYTTGTTIQPTQDTATSATIKLDAINQDNPKTESSYPHRRPTPPSPPPHETTVKSWAEFTKEK